MGQDNSCHPYITSHNCDADSAYGSTYGSNCCDADVTLYHLTTSEESDVDKSYDADDEVEGLTNDGHDDEDVDREEMASPCVDRMQISDNTRRIHGTTGPDNPAQSRSRPDSGIFFCLNKNDERAPEYLMDIIRERAKLSERLHHVLEDDGKRRLYSVEYDVIGTEDDDSGHEGRSTERDVIKPIITFRNHGVAHAWCEDEGLVEIMASYKRRRLCKVKSLPDLRIPLRKKSNRCKNSTYSVSIDRYKGNANNNNNNNNSNNNNNNNNDNNNHYDRINNNSIRINNNSIDRHTNNNHNNNNKNNNNNLNNNNNSNDNNNRNNISNSYSISNNNKMNNDNNNTNNTYTYKTNSRMAADSKKCYPLSSSSCNRQNVEKKALPTSKCVDFKTINDHRLGNFKICHMIETLEK